MRGLTQVERWLLQAALPGAPLRTVDERATYGAQEHLVARGALTRVRNCVCRDCGGRISHMRIEPLGRWLLDVDRMLSESGGH